MLWCSLVSDNALTKTYEFNKAINVKSTARAVLTIPRDCVVPRGVGLNHNYSRRAKTHVVASSAE